VDAGFRLLNTVHRSVLSVSRGRLGRRAFGMEMIELVTAGRRSGRPHTTILSVPVIEGDTLVLVASKGGDDRDPDWLLNLIATPRVEVTWRGKRHVMLARLATPDEAARLWPEVVATYHSYDSYRRRAARVVPLVICTPSESDG
jgi:deazaflavin-dependent oxidoreductase (nitroreductase family)